MQRQWKDVAVDNGMQDQNDMEAYAEALIADEAQVPTEIGKEIGEIYNSGVIRTDGSCLMSAADYE